MPEVTSATYPLQESAHIDGERYRAMYKQSLESPAAFWAKMAEQLDWQTPFRTVSSGSFAGGDVRWFEEGELNVCYNAVDRHALADPQRAAIVWDRDERGESETLSYAQLLREVCQCAGALRELGVRKGDVVGIYMPMVPAGIIAMLACARIGAVHTVIFGGFSADSLRDRLVDGRCRVLLTADEGKRGGKAVKLKQLADAALRECPLVEHVVVYRRTRAEGVAMVAGRDSFWDELLPRFPGYCPPERLSAEDPLFMLYTSGSTGKPKGVVHTQGGYALGALLTVKYLFDVRPGDVFGCVADIGWITGATYVVYGPLLNGVTTVLFESIPTYPDAGRYWHLIRTHGLTQFYTSPTAVRALMRTDASLLPTSAFPTLRTIGSVGEPINPEAWLWLHEKVGFGRCAIVDTYWQTETGSVVIAPMPGAIGAKPGSAALPFFGIEPVIVDPVTGAELHGADVEGALCLRRPWPSMARTIRGDHARFRATYLEVYANMYATSDGAFRDADGYIWIRGRMDDVLNVSGHRISTAELESALAAHADCSECACVGVPDDLTGQAVVAFCCVRPERLSSVELAAELKLAVRTTIGPFAAPKRILLVRDLPKTRSGKVMRRVLRKICAGEDLGDTSTLADPAIVGELQAYFARK